jgi:hypothetical protein
MSLAPGTRVGAYEILVAIGAGGMGEVYGTRDRKLDRDVAIKVLQIHSVIAAATEKVSWACENVEWDIAIRCRPKGPRFELEHL